jgi:hypothetical protein
MLVVIFRERNSRKITASFTEKDRLNTVWPSKRNYLSDHPIGKVFPESRFAMKNSSSSTFSPSHFQARRGQGMVEFALAIPLFLLLVFGVFEFGRLLMTYSAVFSAAREAARYGSAVGVNDINTPYDHDCDGMRAAAVRVGEVGGVRAELIRIRMLGMDGQPKQALTNNNSYVDVGSTWCDAGFSNAGYDTALGDQVEATVAVNYAPVVPLVPIPNLTVNTSTFTGGVNSVSSRTIVKNVQALGVGAGSLTQKTLTVVLDPPDASGGWVTPNPGTYYYNPGDVVTLTAMPLNANWSFAWGGALGGATTPTQILMDDNKTVTITYTRKKFNLSLDKVGMGTLKVDGATVTLPYQNAFYAGTTVQVEAIPASIWSFVGWSNALSGTTTPTSLTLDSDKTLLATFTNATPYTLNVHKNLLTSGSCVTCLVTLSPNQVEYHYGDVVTLTASASLPWAFSSWNSVSGATLSGNPNSNPVTITIQGNSDVTANFLQPGYTVNATPSAEGVLPYAGSLGGTILKTPNQSVYHYGDVVTVQAIPDDKMYFMSWTGSFGLDTTNPKTITVTGDIALTANFKSGYVLNYTVTGDGTVTGAVNNTIYSPVGTPTQVTLTANPNSNRTFLGWTGTVNSTARSITLTMDSDKILLAAFTDAVKDLVLTVNVNNQCGIAMDPLAPWTSPYGPTAIKNNTDPTITATPPVQCIFTGWSGDVTGTANPVTINNMKQNKTVTATFIRKQATLNVNVIFKDGLGQVITGVTGGVVKVNGTAITSPYQANIPYGDTVQLNATPSDYWDFNGWGGDMNTLAYSPTLVMNGNKTATATFTKRLYRLTLNVVLKNAAGQVLTGVSGGTVSVNGAVVSTPYVMDYAQPTAVALVATPASDWNFTGWSGGVTGTTPSTTVTIDSAKTITATFTLRQYSLAMTFAMPKSAKNFTNTVTVTITNLAADGVTVLSTHTATFTDNNVSGVSVVTDVPYSGMFDAGTQVKIEINGANAPGWTVNNLNIPLWSFDNGYSYSLTAASATVTMSGSNKTVKIKYPCVHEAFYVSISTTCTGSPCYLPADSLLSTGINTYLTGLNLNLNFQNSKQLYAIRIEPVGGASQTVWSANPGFVGIGIYKVDWNTYDAARRINQTNFYQLYFDHNAENGSMSINAIKFSNACR